MTPPIDRDDETRRSPVKDTVAALLGLRGPTKLGRFVVIRLVGSGAMGDVYAAYDEELDRKVAVKVLRLQKGDKEDEQRARLLREAQALARLSHPNVVTVHEVGTHDEHVFIAMEYVEGKTLRDWLQKPRKWREIVEMFILAGRGLRAAHAAGLVHRDFKPDNVLVGDDGRPRVVDFGLVTPVGESGQSTVMDLLETRAFEGKLGPMRENLTQSGAVMGTPAYMAPEQLLGLQSDPRTDEYAFCVALYEALSGGRPHESGSFQQLVKERLDGQIPKRPKKRGTPAAPYRVIEKGLALRPEDRYPSMTPLLAALERAASPRRWGLAAAGVLLVGVGVGAATLGQSDEDRCRGSSEAVQTIWNDTLKGQVRAAFDATGVSFANDAYDGVVRRLDVYAKNWETSHRSTCEAMLAGGGAASESVGQQILCLGQRLRQLEETIGLLAKADEAIVGRAAQAVSDLQAVSGCTDPEVLAAWTTAATPEVRAQLEAIDRALAVARANLTMGKYNEGIAALEGQEDAAIRAKQPGSQAQVLEILGELQAKNGDVETGEKTLRRAVRLADQAGDDVTRAWVWVRLVRVVGYQQARYEDGLALGQDALAAIKRLEGSPEMLADLYNNMGSVSMRKGAYEEALEYQRKSLELLRERHGDEHPSIAGTLNNVGNAQTAMGNPKEAENTHRQALAAFERAFGPHHPSVGTSLHNLGNALETAGDHAAAIESYRRALEVRKAALGEQHAAVARTLSNMGQAQLADGKPKEALESLIEAARLKEQALGPDHPSVAYSLIGLGQAHLALKNADAAREPLARALKIHEASKSPAEERGEAAFSLAKATRASDSARAREFAETARESYASTGKHGKQVAAVDAWLQDLP